MFQIHPNKIKVFTEGYDSLRRMVNFFFEVRSNEPLVAIRIGYGIFLVFYFIDKYPMLKMIYGENGLVSKGASGFHEYVNQANFFFGLAVRLHDDTILAILLAGILFAALLCLGVFPRIIPIFSWFLVTIFGHIPGNAGDQLVQCLATLLVFAGMAGHLGSASNANALSSAATSAATTGSAAAT